MANSVIDKRINRLLENSFFVSQNNLWGIDFFELFQAVVPVDNTTIKIIYIRGSISASIERHHRSKRRWNNWHVTHKHPLWANVISNHRTHNRKPFLNLVGFNGANFFKRLLQIFLKFFEINFFENVVYSLGANASFKKRSVFHSKTVVFHLIENSAGLNTLNFLFGI